MHTKQREEAETKKHEYSKLKAELAEEKQRLQSDLKAELQAKSALTRAVDHKRKVPSLAQIWELTVALAARGITEKWKVEKWAVDADELLHHYVNVAYLLWTCASLQGPL